MVSGFDFIQLGVWVLVIYISDETTHLFFVFFRVPLLTFHYKQGNLELLLAVYRNPLIF